MCGELHDRIERIVMVAARRPIQRIVRPLAARLHPKPNPERDAFDRFRRAARTGEPRATYAALMAWLDQTDTSAGAATLRQFSDRIDDPDLSQGLAALENSLYASAAPPQTWSPSSLVRHVRKARRRLLDRTKKGQVTGGTLGPLNPSRPLR